MVLSPGAGFEQPFEMLHACHDRMHRMLGLLTRLREHLPVHGVDEQARQAARDVMRYFNQAAPQHHRDEELHVFPALLAQGNPATVALVTRLQLEHLQMESGWAEARRVLAAIAAGELDSLSAQENRVLDAFTGLYGGHIEAEEQIAYPAAAVLLQGAALEAMSRDMMARRGLR
ncbi:MAG TPA: hemerythrin domain-containing protein [Ramlibacter sp.]|nr:hemerythrin domain-containing protein [Ramlibacter sp.]